MCARHVVKVSVALNLEILFCKLHVTKHRMWSEKVKNEK